MDDIATWLEELGLGQHAELFRANDVTMLPELTEGDLKELGLSLGHRRLLLKTIKGLSNPPDKKTTCRSGFFAAIRSASSGE